MNKQDIWLKKFKETHGELYQYNKFIFNGAKVKSTIVCTKHGEFLQSPQVHNSGSGCPSCGRLKGRKKKTILEFINTAEEVHGARYNYENSIYINALSNINIKCLIHGEFQQIANQHLKGSGCPKCSYITRGEEKRLPINDINNIIDERIKVLNYTKEFPNSVLTLDEKFYLNCEKHGKFETDYRNLIYNESKCKKCSGIVSSQELEIVNYFKDLGVNVETSNRKILEGKEIDIYFPDFKLGIELNGIIWHSTKYGKDTNYHLSKTLLAATKDVTLIHIFEDEFINNKPLILSFIENKLNLNTNKVYARKCKIKVLTNKECKQFLFDYHLKGHVNASICLGLFYMEELVSVMTFSGLRSNLGSKSVEGNFELLRLCSKSGVNVVGGASKLFKFFEVNYKPKRVITYADLRYSNGEVYKNLGFHKISTSTPNYFYVKNGGKRFNRFKFRKSELVKEGFSIELSESKIMEERGYYRIYDCGNIKFEKISVDS